MRYRYSKDIVYNNFPWPKINKSLPLSGVLHRFGKVPAKQADEVSDNFNNKAVTPHQSASLTASPQGEAIIKTIEKTAQGILDARALYPDSSLADLYDPLTMPPELQKAHTENDKAVMKAYGFNIKEMSESDCVAELMRMYQELTEKKK